MDNADWKDTNPKDAIGCAKLPLHLWPGTATAMGCLGLLDGALKYGRSNWRVAGVRASIYFDAAVRHLYAWFEGENKDPDSGLPHMSHALACLAILVDSEAAGKLVDDRMVPGGHRQHFDKLTPHVCRLQKKHRPNHQPKHYTIQDTPGERELPDELAALKQHLRKRLDELDDLRAELKEATR